MNNQPFIIDVRDDDKYQAKHIAGAVHHSHAKILAGQLPDIPKDQPIVTYCTTGNKGARMAQALKEAGFTNVSSSSLPELEQSGHKTVGQV